MLVGEHRFDDSGEYEVIRVGQLSITYRYVGSTEDLNRSIKTSESLHKRFAPKERRGYKPCDEFEAYLLQYGWLRAQMPERCWSNFAAEYQSMTGVSLTEESVGVRINSTQWFLGLSVEFPAAGLSLKPEGLHAFKHFRKEICYHMISNNKLCWSLIEKGMRLGKQK